MIQRVIGPVHNFLNRRSEQYLEFLLFSPLLVGMIAAFPPAGNWLVRTALLIAILFAANVRNFLTAKLDRRANLFVAIATSLSLVLTIYFAWLTESFAATASVIGVLGFLFYKNFSEHNSKLGVVCYAVLIPVFMSALAFLGVNVVVGEVFWPALILGFVPGTMLASAVIARNAKVLEDSGWQRAVESTKGIRPGGICRLYALLLVLGPATGLLLALLRQLPQAFMLLVLLIFLIPRPATALLEGAESNETVFQMTLNRTALAVLMVVIIGVLSRG